MTCLGGLISIDNDSPSEEQDKRIDWAGAFVVTAGLTLIIFILSQGDVAHKQWSTPCKLFPSEHIGCLLNICFDI